MSKLSELLLIFYSFVIAFVFETMSLCPLTLTRLVYLYGNAFTVSIALVELLLCDKVACLFFYLKNVMKDNLMETLLRAHFEFDGQFH